MEDKNINANLDKCENEESVPEERVYSNPVFLDSDNVENKQFDSDNFQKGVEDFSYYAGAFSTLVSSGLSNVEAMELIITKISSDMNIKMTEISSKATIESAKNQSELIEKTQI